MKACRSLLLFAAFGWPTTSSFSTQRKSVPRRLDTVALRSVSVSVSELEKDLTPAERSVTSVVRKCGPAVAYVTSLLPRPGRRREGVRKHNGPRVGEGSLPEGMSLGSGSGFLVSEGYVCTNFHVIERAFALQKANKSVQAGLNRIDEDLTNYFPKEITSPFLSLLKESLSMEKPPQIFVRINSATKYLSCKIVDVEPDLDLAILKVEDSSDGYLESIPAITFGSSNDLLVGQSVIAIGNPFGLDKTVTKGVVSAVNREFRAGTVRTPANRPIRNCIQTDAAINPGNSGGPLLNLKGEVVGINTAIISTSGSNAGIGFAVPADQLKPVVDKMLLKERIKERKRPNSGWLGVSVLKQTMSNSMVYGKNLVTSVFPGSPANKAGLTPLRILDTGRVELGDAIVAVAGNEVETWEELRNELKSRVVGEQIALTLENSRGERRVVYLTLDVKTVSTNTG